MSTTARHRAARHARLRPYSPDFTARHCSGDTCFHAHPGQDPLPVFEDLAVPVPRCDRSGAHGAHDVTTDDGDFRCPGRASMSLPVPQLRRRVAQARAAVAAAMADGGAA